MRYLFQATPAPACLYPLREHESIPNGVVPRNYEDDEFQDEILATPAEHDSGEVTIAWEKWNGGCIIPLHTKGDD